MSQASIEACSIHAWGTPYVISHLADQGRWAVSGVKWFRPFSLRELVCGILNAHRLVWATDTFPLIDNLRYPNSTDLHVILQFTTPVAAEQALENIQHLHIPNADDQPTNRRVEAEELIKAQKQIKKHFHLIRTVHESCTAVDHVYYQTGLPFDKLDELDKRELVDIGRQEELEERLTKEALEMSKGVKGCEETTGKRLALRDEIGDRAQLLLNRLLERHSEAEKELMSTEGSASLQVGDARQAADRKLELMKKMEALDIEVTGYSSKIAVPHGAQKCLFTLDAQ